MILRKREILAQDRQRARRLGQFQILQRSLEKRCVGENGKRARSGFSVATSDFGGPKVLAKHSARRRGFFYFRDDGAFRLCVVAAEKALAKNSRRTLLDAL